MYMPGNGTECLGHECYLRRLAAQLPANPVQPRSCQLQRLGVPVKPDQMPLRSQQPRDPLGVSRQPERAVQNRSACAPPEKIDRLLKKNWYMAISRVRHASPWGGLNVKSGG